MSSDASCLGGVTGIIADSSVVALDLALSGDASRSLIVSASITKAQEFF
jgi:hypothetical protein